MIYDVIVLGGGTSGISAAIYSARFNLKTLLITKAKTGLIATTHIIENYPGVKSATGPEFMNMFYDHITAYKDPSKKGKKFVIKTTKGSYEGKTVIFTLGSEHRKLNVPGEKEFASKGISYCATCDGPLFKNKIVGVAGGADSAAKEALFLTQHAKKVYMIYRREKIRPEPINLKRVQALVKKGKIEIITNTNITEIKGETMANKVIFDKPYKGKKEFTLDGLFIAIGWIPKSDLAAKLGVKLTKGKNIIVDRWSATNISGVFAAGDITDDPFKQVITGAAQGVAAAFGAFNHLRENE
jgi:thioredoxin reductase (NADPH)